MHSWSEFLEFYHDTTYVVTDEKDLYSQWYSDPIFKPNRHKYNETIEIKDDLLTELEI